MSPEEKPGLVSIERVVAFVVGPALTIGAGWLSAFLLKNLSVHVSPAEITGAFATGGAGVAALVYKWLHGRQVYEQVEGSKAVQEIAHSPVEGFITTTLSDLEGMAQSAAAKAVARLTGGSSPPPVSTDPSSEAGEGEGEAPSGL